MQIYLLRNGETLHAAADLRQDPESQLSDRGKQQAVWAAEALIGVGINRILTSPMTRASDTAQIVAKRLGILVQTDERLAEQVSPPQLAGLPNSNPQVLAYLALARSQGITNPDWKYQRSGESMREVVGRAKAFASTTLKVDQQTKMLLVSHRVLLSALIPAILYSWMTPEQMWHVAYGFRTLAHTALSLLSHNYQIGMWELHSFNSTNHLRPSPKLA